MITVLTISAVIVSGILFAIMCKGILIFGELISKTPDMIERHGYRTTPSDAPKEHAELFVIGFFTVFSIGIAVVFIATNMQEAIIGGVMIFSALLFAGTILFYSMQIYSLMRKNMVELKDSVVA
jgi:hypothetical protein